MLRIVATIILGTFTDFPEMARTMPRNLTNSPAHDRYPTWSPNGRTIAFESDREGAWNIYLMNADGSRQRRLTQESGANRYPAWHPSGKRLVFVGDRSGQSDLYIVDVRTKKVVEVARVEGAELFPTWSSDGKWIVFTLVKDLEFGVHRIRPDGTGLERLVTVPGRHIWPRLSPDGRRLVFFSRIEAHGDQDDVYVMDMKTRAIERLTTGTGNDFCPGWSPDGRDLVFVSVGEDGARSLVVRRLGENLVARLGDGFHRVTEPDWSPRGGLITYAGQMTEKDGYDIFVDQAPRERVTTRRSRAGR